MSCVTIKLKFFYKLKFDRSPLKQQFSSVLESIAEMEAAQAFQHAFEKAAFGVVRDSTKDCSPLHLIPAKPPKLFPKKNGMKESEYCRHVS